MINWRHCKRVLDNSNERAGEVMRVGKLIKYLLVLILAAAIISSAVVISDGYKMYKDAVSQESLEDKVAAIRSKKNYTTFNELPAIYVDSVLAVEDHRFYSHPGIDLIATGRAVFDDIRAGTFVEGGSTITQQLAKNMYFSQKKELARKVAEVFVAFDLEKHYSKQDIFELYVNTIYFGNGYYCVKDASEGYFGKEPSQMTDYESTLLAGIPNAPSKYAPTVSPDLAGERQEQVLARLVKYGYITKAQAAQTRKSGSGL